MRYTVDISESSNEQTYLENAARIRRLDPARLVRMLVNVVLRDQMILAILDDDSRAYCPEPTVPAPQKLSERRRQHPYMTTDERKSKILARIDELGGRICMLDLSSPGNGGEWYAALQFLVKNGVLTKHPPAQNKRVYYTRSVSAQVRLSDDLGALLGSMQHGSAA